MQAAAREINEYATQPVIEDLRKLQEIIGTASEVGGYVKFYEQNGNQVAWEIELPGWVTSDVIDRFGRGLNPEKDTERNVIVVKKGVKSDARTRR